MSEEPINSTSTKQLVIGGAAAIVVAVLVLVFFVLPAEFGVDPTGAGGATGLSDLSDMGELTELERGALRTGVFTALEEGYRTNSTQFTLEPFEAIEYKYTLAEGAPLVFSWRASGTVNYDMHAHPFDGGEALTESYGVGEAEGVSGVYIPPFTGIHGWYWQNRTLNPVTVEIDAAGFFTSSTIFDDFGETEVPIDPVD